MKKIISIVGARPQFIKHAPMQLALQKYFNALTLHTGQHYDDNMSAVFFNQLALPLPNFQLSLNGATSHAEQTAIMLVEIEKVCIAEQPAALLVYGDTNSTLAATLVATKLNISIIHIEAGLRSYNRQMPEEVNRIITDVFSKLLFCPTKQAIENLKKEGINHSNIFLTGDVMCDMVNLILPKTKDLVGVPYYFATIHRPYNTDDVNRITKIIETLNSLNKKVVFSIHPRTTSKIESFGIELKSYANLIFIEPVGYVDSISYQKYADCIITDSGGIQKEAYILKKRCITLRSETEWVETLDGNWNTLVFDNLDKLGDVINLPLHKYKEELYGNGKAAEEIATLIQQHI
jgi:UDP-GlcNAc3NAcA epimerase